MLNVIFLCSFLLQFITMTGFSFIERMGKFPIAPSVADPGFPVGGRGPRGGGGAWTPEAAKFHKVCMSKRKNWVP